MQRHLCLILLPLALLCISSVQAYPRETFNGFEFSAFDVTSEAAFRKEIQEWSSSLSSGSPLMTRCDGINMLGGPGILQAGNFVQKNLASLPTHNSVLFRIQLSIMDIWGSGDTVVIELDGQEFTAGKLSSSLSNFPSNFCGTEDPDLDSLYVFGKVAHSAEILTVKIFGRFLGESQASFGIRRVNLLFSNTQSSEDLIAQSCVRADVEMLSEACTCPSGYYRDPEDIPQNPNRVLSSSGCLRCDSKCSECFGPSASECYVCNPSESASFVNGECIKCHESCSSCSGPNENECIKCAEELWYKWDGTCSKTCDSPTYAQDIFADDAKLCKTPCEEGYFYLWNGTCSAQCPEPLVSSTSNLGKLCSPPCDTSEYLYTDGSCSSGCSDTMVKSFYETNLLRCKEKCDIGEFLYDGNICRSGCEPPFSTKTTTNAAGLVINKCVFPCSDSEYYILDYNGKCTATCNPPNIIVQRALYKSCLNETPAIAKFSSAAFQIGMKVMSVSSAVGAVTGVGDSFSAILALFMKMLPYIKYIDIKYPQKLQLMLDDITSPIISFSFGIPMPEKWQGKFEKHSLPGNFAKYESHSSFFVNYWETMTSLAVLLALIVLISILCLISRKNKRLYYFFERLKLVVKWNFFLMIFSTNFDNIVLNTSFELRTIQITSFLPAFSLIFCLFVNAAAFFVLGLVYYIIKDIRQSKNRDSHRLATHESIALPYTQEKWESFQLFYKGSRDENYVSHIFLLPFLLRLYIFYVVLAYLFEHPLVQVILIILLNVFVLFYMIWKKPFVSKLAFVQHVNDEIITFTVNICLLYLVVLDVHDIEAPQSRQALGDAIIYLNIIFSFTANFFLICSLLTGFRTAYQKTRAYKTKGIVAWFGALLSPYEVGGMDLETVVVTEGSLILSPKKRGNNLQNEQSSDSRKQNEKVGSSFFLKGLEHVAGESSLKVEEKHFRVKSPLSLLRLDLPQRSSSSRRTSSFNDMNKMNFLKLFNIPRTPRTEINIRNEEDLSPVKEMFSPSGKLLRVNRFPSEESNEMQKENSEDER